MKEKEEMFCTTLPSWLVQRINELEKKTGLDRAEIVKNALCAEIYPVKSVGKTSGLVAALVAIFLLAIPVGAQEQTVPPPEPKLKPPIVLEESASEPVKSEPVQPTAEPPAPPPVVATVKKPNKALRKARFFCNFAAPFVNFAAAVKNCFN